VSGGESWGWREEEGPGALRWRATSMALTGGRKGEVGPPDIQVDWVAGVCCNALARPAGPALKPLPLPSLRATCGEHAPQPPRAAPPSQPLGHALPWLPCADCAASAEAGGGGPPIAGDVDFNLRLP
jgi:hypothetical protein